jgi:hypothetical protein
MDLHLEEGEKEGQVSRLGSAEQQGDAGLS